MSILRKDWLKFTCWYMWIEVGTQIRFDIESQWKVYAPFWLQMKELSIHLISYLLRISATDLFIWTNTTLWKIIFEWRVNLLSRLKKETPLSVLICIHPLKDHNCTHFRMQIICCLLKIAKNLYIQSYTPPNTHPFQILDLQTWFICYQLKIALLPITKKLVQSICQFE